MPATLKLQEMTFLVNLGWGEEERQALQTVVVEIKVKLASVPKACETDELQDTVCYDTLTQQLQKRIEGCSFRLIEHLAQVLFDAVVAQFSADDQVQVSVTKQPPMNQLETASFILSST